MKTFVKCEMCNAEPANKCVFAAFERVVNGKKRVYCCMIMQQQKCDRQ